MNTHVSEIIKKMVSGKGQNPQSDEKHLEQSGDLREDIIF